MPLLLYCTETRTLYNNRTFYIYYSYIKDYQPPSVPLAPPAPLAIQPMARNILSPIKLLESLVAICTNPISSHSRVAETVKDIAN